MCEMELSGQSVDYIHQTTMVGVITFRKEVGEYFSSSGKHLPFSKNFVSAVFIPFWHLCN